MIHERKNPDTFVPDYNFKVKHHTDIHSYCRVFGRFEIIANVCETHHSNECFKFNCNANRIGISINKKAIEGG